MESINQNLFQNETIQQKLLKHIQSRKKIKQMYSEKGIQMLDKQELVFSDIQEPKLTPTQNMIYKSMQTELSQNGYDEFRFLGQGAQGLVLLAKEKQTKKRYAIKGIHFCGSNGNIDESAFNQVQQEINMLNQCKGSPYVVNFVRYIEGNEFIFLVLSECLGTLNEIIQKAPNQKLNELSAIKYAKDIAEGLYFIHSKNCLVNDLKMDNILIDYNGNAVVSDFGFADKLTQQSGYAMDQYKGNIQFKAPECYEPSQYEVYFNEYNKLGLQMKKEPSSRSEACSLGYMLYTMISGFKTDLIFKKHEPLKYEADFQKFIYEKQLRYIMDGLTKFIPRERLKIKEVLIILKGIISFEFELDSKFIEVIDDEAAQRIINIYNKDIEYVQGFGNKFYMVIKNEKELVQQLNSEIYGHSSNQKQESYIEELNQKIKGLEKIINDLQNQQENQNQNIQHFFYNQQANPQQILMKDCSQNLKTGKNEDIQNYEQNLIKQNVQSIDDNFNKKRGYVKRNLKENEYIYSVFNQEKKNIGFIRCEDATKEQHLVNVVISDFETFMIFKTVFSNSLIQIAFDMKSFNLQKMLQNRKMQNIEKHAQEILNQNQYLKIGKCNQFASHLFHQSRNKFINYYREEQF